MSKICHVRRDGILNLYRYQRAYVDFFEDQLVLNGYNWKKVLADYLFTGKEPLINCLVGGRTYKTNYQLLLID